MTKILVIEDEELLRANTIQILEFEDFHTIAAENGLMGVQLAPEQIPDLILCDVMMPKLDGYGVLVALRQNPATAGIPFIFTTAKSSKADLRQGMGLGADDFLTKGASRNKIYKLFTL
jgi:CheY-like chemotaxis protein